MGFKGKELTHIDLWDVFLFITEKGCCILHFHGHDVLGDTIFR